MLVSSDAENRNNKRISARSKGDSVGGGEGGGDRSNLDFLIHPVPPNELYTFTVSSFVKLTARVINWYAGDGAVHPDNLTDVQRG